MPIVTDGLTSHWDFKEGTGTTITDIVGTDDGTLQGTTTNFWAKTDRSGDAVGNFNGSDNVVRMSGVTFPAGDFSVAIAVWVKHNKFDALRGLLQFRSGPGFSITTSTTGFTVAVKDAVNPQVAVSLDLSWCWQHWVIIQVTYDAAADTLTLRAGKKEASVGTATIAAPTGTQFQVGLTGASSWGSMRIADVLWYDGKVLSSPELDQNVDALTDRFYGTPTVDTTDDTWSKTIIPLPDDGNGDGADRVNENTPLYTTTDHIFAAMTRVSGVNSQPVFYRFDKSWATEQTITPFSAVSLDATHQGAPLAIDPNGKVILFRGKHNDTFEGRVTNNVEDLSAHSALATPYNGTEHLTYPRFFRRIDGTILYGTRDDQGTTWWVWNETAQTWSQLGGASIFGGSGIANITYRGWFAEDSTGVLYATAVWTTTAGNPTRYWSLIKYNGTSWTRVVDGGGVVSLPAALNETDALIPHTDVPANIVQEANSGEMAVDDQDRLHGVFAWRNQLDGETDLNSIYHVFHDTTADEIIRRKIFENDGTAKVGGPHIIASGSDLHVYFSEFGSGTTSKVYLFTTHDYGETWTRRVLHDVLNENPGLVPRPDPRSLAIDSVVRQRVYYSGDSTAAEVWEFALPSAASEVTVQASPATVTFTAQDVTPVRAGSAVQASPATVTLTAQAVNPVITGAPVSVTLIPASLTLSASALVVSGGTTEFFRVEQAASVVSLVEGA